MRGFCYGLQDSTGQAVVIGNEPVVRLVVLSGVENPFEKMVCLTVSGKVHLRSIDGKKSVRAKPDMFIADAGTAPEVITA